MPKQLSFASIECLLSIEEVSLSNLELIMRYLEGLVRWRPDLESISNAGSLSLWFCICWWYKHQEIVTALFLKPLATWRNKGIVVWRELTFLLLCFWKWFSKLQNACLSSCLKPPTLMHVLGCCFHSTYDMYQACKGMILFQGWCNWNISPGRKGRLC